MVITLLALIFKQYVYTHPYLDVNVCCIFRLPSWGGPLDVTPRLLLVTSLLYSIGFPPRKKGHTIARVIFPDAWVTWAVFVDRVTVLFTRCSSLRNGSTVPLLTLICLNWKSFVIDSCCFELLLVPPYYEEHLVELCVDVFV